MWYDLHTRTNAIILFFGAGTFAPERCHVSVMLTQSVIDTLTGDLYRARAALDAALATTPRTASAAAAQRDTVRRLQATITAARTVLACADDRSEAA